MQIKLGISAVLLLAVAFLPSCEEKSKEPGKADFDRKALLTNIGANIILPAYQAFKASTDELNNAVGQFMANPSEAGLSNAQNKFKDAYKAYQAISLFEFGPAEQELIRASFNTFPASVSKINNNISAGTYDLNTASNLDAKGFPALDYLLFGTGSNAQAILTQYTTDANAAKRKKYLTDLSQEIKTKTDKVNNAWSASGGNYLNTFITAEGTDVGSSLGQLVNQLNFDYEIIKNPKVGIPLGIKTLGTAIPENVEAYYSGMSAELTRLQIGNIENVYLGRDKQGANGVGLDDYLIKLDAKRGEGSLHDAITSQFSVTKTKLSALADPLAQMIRTNPAPVNEAYNEVHKGVVLLKTDMPSALGVLITYQDNDGD